MVSSSHSSLRVPANSDPTSIAIVHGKLYLVKSCWNAVVEMAWEVSYVIWVTEMEPVIAWYWFNMWQVPDLSVTFLGCQMSKKMISNKGDGI